MSDNPFDAPSASAADHTDDEFDKQIAKMWMNRTWGVAGSAIGISLLSFCCNPFGIVGIIAVVAGVGGIVRALSAPPQVRMHLGGIQFVALGLSVLAFLLSSGVLAIAMLGLLASGSRY